LKKNKSDFLIVASILVSIFVIIFILLYNVQIFYSRSAIAPIGIYLGYLVVLGILSFFATYSLFPIGLVIVSLVVALHVKNRKLKIFIIVATLGFVVFVLAGALAFFLRSAYS
jgi:hypothetical protein